MISSGTRDIVRFEGVSKAYRNAKAQKVILQDFSGGFPFGRNIGLLGLNGAGKSTILRMIAGAEFPDKGEIRRFARISYPLGFAGSFKGSMSGRENCRFVARIYGASARPVERFVEDFAEIGDYIEMPVSTYSSGMRARVAFALSMAIDFDCYLVDETLSVGDATFKQRCAAAFEARRKQASVIMVSHSPSTVRQFCNAGAVLAGGQLLVYDKLDDAVAAYDQLIGAPGKGSAAEED